LPDHDISVERPSGATLACAGAHDHKEDLMRLSRTFMGAVIAMLVVALAIVISGKESGGTPTASTPTPPIETAATTAASTPTQTATTAAVSSYPVISFTYNQEGAWPFTAQIASVRENTTGFPGTAIVSPGYTVLMVQVNITSKTVRSVVPGPAYIKVLCSGPNSGRWKDEYNDNGYDEGSEAKPDPAGNNIAPGDGLPHPWDAEWEVPEGTNTENLQCSMEVQEHMISLN
jgi:hypothetical protein